MKPTCMIIAMLFLMACQFVTADYLRASDLENVAASLKASDPIYRAIMLRCCFTDLNCPALCK
uniref:Conotoxin superfamily O1 n=1 Tax=Conus ermineus TaxID=55423 RepID=A0A346CIH9_CONER|nr:conotoxin precursor superfamily O1 [Conus ermineus]